MDLFKNPWLAGFLTNQWVVAFVSGSILGYLFSERDRIIRKREIRERIIRIPLDPREERPPDYDEKFWRFIKSFPEAEDKFIKHECDWELLPEEDGRVREVCKRCHNLAMA